MQWHAAIRDHLPAYDPALTPTRGVGAVAECFRHQPGALRSGHPLASFTAVGPLAAAITANHPLVPAFGEDSPLARLYELDAGVLLLGVGHERNTSLHLAEHRAEWRGKRLCSQGAPILRDGVRHWVTYDDLQPDDGDFADLGEAFCKAGHERVGCVGQAHSRWVAQRAIVDFAVR